MVLLRAKVYYQSKLHCLDYKPFLCTWHVFADHLMKVCFNPLKLHDILSTLVWYEQEILY